MQTTLLTQNGIALRVWWAWIWRCFLLSLPLQLIEIEQDEPSPVLMVAIMVGMAVLSAILLRHVFNRRYKRFDIYFADTATGARLKPSWYHVLCVYWSMTWRTMLVWFGLGTPMFIGAILMTAPDFAGNPNSLEGLMAFMTAALVVGVVLIIITTLVSIYIVRIVIAKRYKQFYTRVDQNSGDTAQHSQQVLS